jgi:hypothetical protein
LARATPQGLAAPPADPADFLELGEAIVRSPRISALLADAPAEQMGRVSAAPRVSGKASAHSLPKCFLEVVRSEPRRLFLDEGRKLGIVGMARGDVVGEALDIGARDAQQAQPKLEKVIGESAHRGRNARAQSDKPADLAPNHDRTPQ